MLGNYLQQTTFSVAFFLGALRVKSVFHVSKHVSLQMLCPSKTFSANPARVGFLPSMTCKMHKTVSICYQRMTKATSSKERVKSVFHVSKHVSIQMLFPSKTFSANSARVGFLSIFRKLHTGTVSCQYKLGCVSLYRRYSCSLGCKMHKTVFICYQQMTKVTSSKERVKSFFHVSKHVSLQMLFPSKTFSANSARVGFLSSMN